jgi:hypothetical protein
MPYEVGFVKRMTIPDRKLYINDCCVGGDLVVRQLLPLVEPGYSDILTEQEDWGWFIWFRDGEVRLAIDVFTDDADKGMFRILLTSRRRRWLLADTVIDTPELDRLRDLVVSALTEWTGSACTIVRVQTT